MEIRVLIVSESKNPYIEELTRELGKHIHAKNSIVDFLERKGDYSVVHLHWPEELSGWQPPEPSQIEQIRKALKYWKRKAALVITRHNVLPNQPEPFRYQPLYELVYAHVDAVVHLGKYSLDTFEPYRPNNPLIHRVIYHHVYKSYPNKSDRKTARRHLKIPARKQVILCFGNIRTREQASLILKAYKKVNEKAKFLLIPRYYRKLPAVRRKPLRRIWHHLKSWYYKNFLHIVRGVGFVDPDAVHYYFNAADVVFIPRNRQLNSGVVFLALAFEKVVAGPDSQNMGEMVRSLNNPVFKPDDIVSAASALERALQLSRGNKGVENLRRASVCYSLEQSVHKHLQLYKELVTVHIG